MPMELLVWAVSRQGGAAARSTLGACSAALAVAPRGGWLYFLPVTGSLSERHATFARTVWPNTQKLP